MAYLNIVADAGEVLGISVILLIIMFVSLAICWIPGAIAHSRRHRNASAIAICGLCGIFVWPCFFVALIWAFTNNIKPRRRRRRLARQYDDAEQWPFP